MSEVQEPAVALLFDDTELGGHLRQALQQLGARVVHEGGVAGFNRALLDTVNPDVLVVNLDDSADDAPDELYDLVGGGRPRVVFNDAQASRDLDGWDRARWARHLAVKVMAEGELDPPRPAGARGLDMPDLPVAAVATFEPVAEASTMPAPTMSGDEQAENSASTDTHPAGSGDEHQQVASAESEMLAAELEALLAAEEFPADSDDPDASASVEADLADKGDESVFEMDGDPVDFVDETAQSTHDGVFDDWLTDDGAESGEQEGGAAATEQEPVAEGLDALFAPAREDAGDVSKNSPRSDADSLSLAPRVDGPAATMASTDEAAPAMSEPTPVSAPAEWALLDDAAEPLDATAFGIEKLSAAEFLAPDVESDDEDAQPTMSLELVSLEESVAPQAFQPSHEMVLDDTGTALSRIVLLGAATSATESVGDFLAALPDTTRLTFLLISHCDVDSADELLEQLSARSPVPVRLAADQGLARAGEVLITPPDAQITLRRDGRIIATQHSSSDAAQSHAIDACLTMGASAFGRDALAIVFAGSGTDAVAGCQAVHDRGGRVWVESAPGDYAADMVSDIFAERLVDFSGTPQDLAAHLVEVFP